MDKDFLKKTSDTIKVIKETATTLLAEQNRINTILKTAMVGLNGDQLKLLMGLQDAVNIFMKDAYGMSGNPILWNLAISLRDFDGQLIDLIRNTQD